MLSILIEPRFGDVDGLGHINNTVIPGWFEQARTPIYRCFNPELKFTDWNLILARFEIDFVSQMYFDKEVEIKTFISRIGKSSLEVYQEAWQSGSLCTKGKTVLVHFDFKQQKSIEIPLKIREIMQEHLLPHSSKIREN